MDERPPDTDGLVIPKELEWLEEVIRLLDHYQQIHNLNNPFVYVTVRHGLVTSETDDIWHVDGFSMKTKHVPEQNYLWVDSNPTEYLTQKFDIPDSFDPMKHHLHWYFDDRACQENIRECEKGIVYLFDPYFIHRRPKEVVGKMRTFWRVSFTPIEIEDGMCTQNPLLPAKNYVNDDVRHRLVRFLMR